MIQFFKNSPLPIKIMIVVVLLSVMVLPTLIQKGGLYPGIVGGLVAWLISYLLAKWFDQETQDKLNTTNKKLKECLDAISETQNQLIEYHKEELKFREQNITTILNTIQNKYLPLITTNRYGLTDDDYNNYFRNSQEVKISGIANTALIENLLDRHDNQLITSLTNKNKSNVRVKVLMAHPKSEFVKIRDFYEYETSDETHRCSKKIIKNLNLLRSLARKYKTTKLPRGNMLKIVLSYTPFDSAITYIKKYANEDNDEILLMSPIYNHHLVYQEPLYQIPKETPLFYNCQENFDHIFNEGQKENKFTVFLWNKDGAKFYLEVLQKEPNF